MKKIYSNPKIEVVKIKVHQLLSTSPNQVNDIVGQGDPLGREFDFEFEE